MAKIVVTKQWAKENKDFVIYNYFAEKKNVTPEQTQKDLKERFDIVLTMKKIKEILQEYVKNGLLSQRVSNYIWVG